jgi:ribosomal protein L37AE/L43A
LPNIDFDALHDAADVRTVAETYLEPAREKGRFVCPSCGKGNVTARPKVWGCWSCSAHAAEGIGRDAIGLVALATSTSRIDAAKRLAGDLGIGPMVATAAPGRPAPRRAIEPKPTGPEPPELESWSKGLAGVLHEAHGRLMDQSCDTSRRAWDYLIRRGLLPETIEGHGLGINFRWRDFHEPLPGEDKPCYLPPGITIPWVSALGFAGANVRQFHEPLRDKYLTARGSRRWWLYPAIVDCWDDWTGPVVIVEGEFDALLANQELSGLLPVFTAGGAACHPHLLKEPHKLTRFSHLLIAADDDDAGHNCRDAWRAFSPRRSVPVDLPGGKDLTEAHAAGHDLRKWLFEVCRGLGIDLRALPGLVWEKPLGTIRGRLLDDPRHAAESEAEAAAERFALMHEGGHGGRS